jgi:hypothetical protein
MANDNLRGPARPQIGQWAASGIVVALGGLVSIGPDKTLQWEFDPERVRWKNPPENLLDQFATLWQKKASATVAFANKWGPLRIDETGKEIDVATNRAGSEPLSWWRYLSHRAHNTLRIAKMLEDGMIVTGEDWDFLASIDGVHIQADGSWPDLTDVSPFGLPSWETWKPRKRNGYSDLIAYAKATIAGEASAWLQQFGVRLCVEWGESSWQIKMMYGGRMLSAVALQMAFAIAHGDRLFTCSGCGRPYTRAADKRKPNAGQGNFCPECATARKPQARAERIYREKRREARRLASEGTPIVEIANKLDRTTDVVRGWLKGTQKNVQTKAR